MRCDGLVAATPVGSTGYNLANGGPILAWGVEGYVVSFIAPHTLTTRPLVVAPDDVLHVHNLGERDAVDIAIDGVPHGSSEPGDELEVRFRNGLGCLAQLEGATFYRRIREKFGRLDATRARRDASPDGAQIRPVARVLNRLRLDVARAENREPAADRAHRAALRGGPERDHGRDRAPARPCSRTRSTCCSAASRRAASSGPAPRRRGSRAPSTSIRRCARSRRWPSCSTAFPRARARSCSPAGVSAAGRSSAFVAGRAASAADLRALGTRLLAFYGQHEHRKLTLASAQAEILDSFAGAKHLELRAAYREAHRAVVAIERELEEIQDREGARERDLDLLRFELAEIDEVAPDPERAGGAGRRARPAARARVAARAAGRRRSPRSAAIDDEGGGAARLLAAPRARSPAPPASTPSSTACARAPARWRSRRPTSAASCAAIWTGSRPTRSGSRARGAARGGRASAAQARRHGRRGSRARRALPGRDRTPRPGRRACRGTGRRARRCRGQAGEAGRAAERLARARPRRGSSSAVVAELGELAMDGARLEVSLPEREDGYGPNGREGIELLVATNPGLPLSALGETASGGELSRVMLALAGLGAGEGVETLVFDEIDAGVGGKVARRVGERLRGLGEGRQVICITHLPQVASQAAAHFRVAQVGGGRDGERHGRAGRRRGAGRRDRPHARRRRRRRGRRPARPRTARGLSGGRSRVRTAPDPHPAAPVAR